MSRLGKFLLLVAGLCILGAGAARLILGGWIEWLYAPVVVFGIAFVAAIIVDIGFFKEFLTMRTTKHGMNMGVMILLTIVLLVAVNFLAVRHNVKWDFTTEGLNSLSDQSVKVAQTLDDDAKIRFFYRGGVDGIDQAKQQFTQVVGLFKDENSKVSIEFIDSIKRPGLAKEYDVKKAAAQVFVDYKGKRNALESLDEEGLTKALLKVTREKNKKLYFLTGHGEADISEEGPAGASIFKKSLVDTGYDVESLSLIDKGAVPEDADMLLIVAPKTALLDSELKAIRDYARAGGKLFVAGDPGQNHNLPLLTKTFGVEFGNDFVLDRFGQMLGAGPTLALGREYGPTPITKDFNRSMTTLFYLASSLKKDPNVDSAIAVEEVVSAGNSSFTVDSIAGGKVKMDENRLGPHNLIMTSKGKLPSDGEKDSTGETSTSAEFTAVIAGDADFVGNQFFVQQLNRDLAMNAMAYVLKENNLISIRPKQPVGTTLSMDKQAFAFFLLGVILPIPLLLFGTGGVTWYRRRNA